MLTHPSKCTARKTPARWNYRTKFVRSQDHALKEKTKSVRGSERGDYMMLTDERERITLPMVAFFADTFISLPDIHPDLRAEDM